MIKIFVKKLYEDSIIPTQAHQGDAGWDLYAHGRAIIQPQSNAKIGTGVSIALPQNTFGAIYARSGLANKQGLRPSNCVGVCDSDYRGEYIVSLYNDSMEPQIVENGERIAQLIVQEYVPVEMNVVEELNDTERGTGGFGSSGK